MGTFLGVVFLLAWIFCTVMFMIGMIDPNKAILAFAKRGRKQVFLSWFLAGLVCCILFMVSVVSDIDNKEEVIAETTPTIEATKKPDITPEPTPAPTPTPTEEPTPEPTIQPVHDWYNDAFWETEEANIAEFPGNMNVISATKLFTIYTVGEIEEIPITEDSLEKMEQALWKYPGKMVKFKIEIDDITSYAPNSNVANNVANGNECGEIMGYDPTSYDGYSSIIVNGSACDNYNSEDVIEVTAIMIGYIEGQNVFGEAVQNMVFYTVPELIK